MKSLDDILLELRAIKKSPWEDPMEKIWGNSPKARLIYAPALLAALENIFLTKERILLARLLHIVLYDGCDDRYTDIFCRLLKENWHREKESIIFMLEKIRDPKSVQCIYVAAITLPDYDDPRSLAKKCIRALATINTDEAKKSLEKLAKLKDKIIRNAALEQMAFGKNK